MVVDEVVVEEEDAVEVAGEEEVDEDAGEMIEEMIDSAEEIGFQTKEGIDRKSVV